MVKYKATAGTALFVLLVFIVPVILAPSFETCIANIPGYAVYQHQPEGLSYFFFSLLEKFRCAGDFVHVNADAIIAVFTVVLAIATIRLWVSTNHLWEGAERSSERQLRAYVLVESGNVYDASRIGLKFADPSATLLPQWTNFVAMELSIKNSGQTPAKNVRHWAQMAVSSAAEEDTLVPPAILDNKQRSVMGPGIVTTKTRIWHPFPLAEPVLSAIKSGDLAIYVYGKIAYDDWFGTPRETVYRLRYSGNWPPMPSGTLTFCLDGNDAT